jgi:hypothetical protein
MKLNGFDSCHRPFRFCNYTDDPSIYSAACGILLPLPTSEARSLEGGQYNLDFCIIYRRDLPNYHRPFIFIFVISHSNLLALYLINQYSRDLLLMQQIP